MVESVIRHPAPEGTWRVAFAGCRPQKMPFGLDETDERCLDFKKRLHNTIEVLIDQGYMHFLSGGSMGMDMFAAEAVLDLKDKYSDIVLEMVSPFDAQAAKWAPEYRERHDLLFDAADIVTATGHEYTKSAMFARNRYMVNHANVLLAAYDGKTGGTQKTVQFARQAGIQIYTIRPVVK